MSEISTPGHIYQHVVRHTTPASILKSPNTTLPSEEAVSPEPENRMRSSSANVRQVPVCVWFFVREKGTSADHWCLRYVGKRVLMYICSNFQAFTGAVVERVQQSAGMSSHSAQTHQDLLRASPPASNSHPRNALGDLNISADTEHPLPKRISKFKSRRQEQRWWKSPECFSPGGFMDKGEKACEKSMRQVRCHDSPESTVLQPDELGTFVEALLEGFYSQTTGKIRVFMRSKISPIKFSFKHFTTFFFVSVVKPSLPGHSQDFSVCTDRWTDKSSVTPKVAPCKAWLKGTVPASRPCSHPYSRKWFRDQSRPPLFSGQLTQFSTIYLYLKYINIVNI